jgi:hypothetical protein
VNISWPPSIPLRSRSAAASRIEKRFGYVSGRHTDQEIEEVWKLQYPSYDFLKGEHRLFLTRVRELLGDR